MCTKVLQYIEAMDQLLFYIILICSVVSAQQMNLYACDG